MKTAATKENCSIFQPSKWFFNKKEEGGIGPTSSKMDRPFFFRRPLTQKSSIDSQLSGENNSENTAFFRPKSVIQTKLSINEPGDKYEQEADQMADLVVQRLSETDTNINRPNIQNYPNPNSGFPSSGNPSKFLNFKKDPIANPSPIQTNQQSGGTPYIQRAPIPNIKSDTESLHDDLTREYSQEAGIQDQPGLQYSADYEQWLRARTGTGARFHGYTPIPQNPLDRQKQGKMPGETMFKINGQIPTGATVGDLIDDYKRLITPANIRHNRSEDSSQVSCRFDYQFQLNTEAEIIIATTPGRNGWKANMSPNQVLTPPLLSQFPDCGNTNSTAVTLQGTPSNQAFHDLVRDSEIEHANELKTLHERHFVPFYQFTMNLTETGDTQSACEANLNARLGKRNDQAALGFVLGDMTATERYDAPTSTHHGDSQAVVGNQCQTITLTSTQRNPQDPQREPGNVLISPPAIQQVKVAGLQAQGAKLSDGQGFSQTFPSATVANQVMALFNQLDITAIQTLGPLCILMKKGRAAIGPVAPASDLQLDARLYQVTANLPGPGRWSITEVQGTDTILILDFGANRDQAYSAVQVMRDSGVSRQVWFGAVNNPDFLCFIG
ncbi:MAG: hypothetical protein WD398_07155 [Cyclobacteriaceae bacterium]